MNTYKIEISGDVLKVGFGEPAQNNQIVCDASARLDEMIESEKLLGGPLLKINGAASLPVAFVIAHKVAHLYGAIGVWDPKMGKYVIAITHNPTYELGGLID